MDGKWKPPGMNNVDILGQPSVSKHNLWLNLTKVLLYCRFPTRAVDFSQFRDLIEDHQRVVLARIFPKLSSWLRFFVESHFPFRLGLPSLILVSQLLRVACFANHWVVRFFFLSTKLVSICLQLEAFVQSLQRHKLITLNKNTSNTFPWRIHVIMVYDLHLPQKINHSCRNKPGFNNQSAPKRRIQRPNLDSCR